MKIRLKVLTVEDSLQLAAGFFNPNYDKYVLAADLVLIVHFAFVAFIVFGFLLIWIGYYFKSEIVQNAKFRILHLLSMAVVLGESLAGKLCPLTGWENDLRLKGGQSQIYETGFMQDWVHKILFYDFSEDTFVIIYIFFFILMLLTFWIIPPKIHWKRK